MNLFEHFEAVEHASLLTKRRLCVVLLVAGALEVANAQQCWSGIGADGKDRYIPCYPEQTQLINPHDLGPSDSDIVLGPISSRTPSCKAEQIGSLQKHPVWHITLDDGKRFVIIQSKNSLDAALNTRKQWLKAQTKTKRPRSVKVRSERPSVTGAGAPTQE